ncbi:MAG: PASTA domain-containing protein, partial [Clostridiales bacterium]|nr:PASTA domain-containing protein [Clostridiales bacterium]
IRRRRSREKYQQRSKEILKTAQRQKLVKKRNRQIALIVIGSLLTIGALVFGGGAIYQNVILTTHVPELFGEDVANAQALLEDAQLLGEAQNVSSEHVEAGKVISQVPSSGERIKKGETVVYHVSTGKNEILLPDLVGVFRESATTMLSASGIVLEISERKISDQKADLILEQIPPANTQVQPGQIVQVVLSGGKAVMPDVCGKRLGEAMEALNEYDLSLLTIKGVEVNKNRPAGMVVQQYPLAQTETILRIPVKITVADPRWQPYQGMISQQLEAPQKDSLVQVVLETKGGEEILQWEQEQKAGEKAKIRDVIYYTQEGEYTYHIYRNGELLITEKVVLAGESKDMQAEQAEETTQETDEIEEKEEGNE